MSNKVLIAAFYFAFGDRELIDVNAPDFLKITRRTKFLIDSPFNELSGRML